MATNYGFPAYRPLTRRQTGKLTLSAKILAQKQKILAQIGSIKN